MVHLVAVLAVVLVEDVVVIKTLLLDLLEYDSNLETMRQAVMPSPNTDSEEPTK